MLPGYKAQIKAKKKSNLKQGKYVSKVFTNKRNSINKPNLANLSKINRGPASTLVKPGGKKFNFSKKVSKRTI